MKATGLPWWLSGKESACNAGDTGDSSLIPGSEGSPGGGPGNPREFLPRESHGHCVIMFTWYWYKIWKNLHQIQAMGSLYYADKTA